MATNMREDTKRIMLEQRKLEAEIQMLQTSDKNCNRKEIVSIILEFIFFPFSIAELVFTILLSIQYNSECPLSRKYWHNHMYKERYCNNYVQLYTFFYCFLETVIKCLRNWQ